MLLRAYYHLKNEAIAEQEDRPKLMSALESPDRIEPARIEDPTAELADVIADLITVTATLDKSLHPATASSLADAVRLMNTYYSNLIEGHNTRPRDIERALAGQLDPDEASRNLQLEAAGHVRVQAEIDAMALQGVLASPTSTEFILWTHREFYRDSPAAFLRVKGPSGDIVMTPGALRSRPEEDNAVGRHVPPSSEHVKDFMDRFERRYDLKGQGTAARVLTLATSHHRLNYIHPFPDGNGRVSRLMSHAIAQSIGVGAHGLWSVSRGMARGLHSRSEYRQMMDRADTPRQSDLDGRGNLSLRALNEFALWFLRVCLDQAQFMTALFDLDTLKERLRRYAARDERLKDGSTALLEEALVRGQFERGEVGRITGLPERTARRVLSGLTTAGLLASKTEKGPVSLRFPEAVLEDLFPRLYPQL